MEREDAHVRNPTPQQSRSSRDDQVGPTDAARALPTDVEADAGRDPSNSTTVVPMAKLRRLRPTSNPRGAPVLLEGEHLDGKLTVLVGDHTVDSSQMERTGTGMLAIQIPKEAALGDSSIRVLGANGQPITSLPFSVLAEYPPGIPSPEKIIPLGTAPTSRHLPLINRGVEVVQDSRNPHQYNHNLMTVSPCNPNNIDVLIYDDSNNAVKLIGQLAPDEEWTVHLTATTIAPTAHNQESEQYKGRYNESGTIVLYSELTGRQLVLNVGFDLIWTPSCPEGWKEDAICSCGELSLCVAPSGGVTDCLRPAQCECPGSGSFDPKPWWHGIDVAAPTDDLDAGPLPAAP